MVCDADAEESCVHCLARREAQWRVAQHRHGVLVLQAPAGKLADDATGRLAGSAREPVEIQCVGGEGSGAPQRSDQAPGGTSFRPLILPGGDQRPALRIGKRCVIDILADVVFVHPHRSVGCECQILSICQVQLLRLG